ncbi:DUF2272 domain-containing protein [Piscinibacter sakaiensis]|uniref:DUF2272 domain-containing protein n=1 Tax=Piscinibacter sakaiensis TaxID=1547922 RepID=UPI003AAB3F8F
MNGTSDSPLRVAALLLAVLLAACAPLPQAPPKVPVPPTTVPPTRIERLVELLEQEWVRWGRGVVVTPPGDTACLIHPDGYCDPIADGCGQEKTAALCPVVNEYWAAISYRQIRHDCRRTDVCEVQWPESEAEPPQRTPPWSAAFVSAMMQRAGFSSREFRPAPAHADYVVAARDGTMSAYAVVPTPARAAPGDLICAVRGRSALTPADIALITDGAFATPMHCDIVVKVDLAARRLEAIGGNVQQTVARSIVALDSDGRVSFDIDPQRPWLLVLKARRAAAPQAADAR